MRHGYTLLPSPGQPNKLQTIACSLSPPIDLPLRRWIGAGEAVAGDFPAPIAALSENEQLLIRFRTLRARSINRCRPGRIGAREDPVGCHLNNLGDTELDAQLD